MNMNQSHRHQQMHLYIHNLRKKELATQATPFLQQTASHIRLSIIYQLKYIHIYIYIHVYIYTEQIKYNKLMHATLLFGHFCLMVQNSVKLGLWKANSFRLMEALHATEVCPQDIANVHLDIFVLTFAEGLLNKISGSCVDDKVDRFIAIGKMTSSSVPSRIAGFAISTGLRPPKVFMGYAPRPSPCFFLVVKQTQKAEK